MGPFTKTSSFGLLLRLNKVLYPFLVLGTWYRELLCECWVDSCLSESHLSPSIQGRKSDWCPTSLGSPSRRAHLHYDFRASLCSPNFLPNCSRPALSSEYGDRACRPFSLRLCVPFILLLCQLGLYAQCSAEWWASVLSREN